MIPVYLAVDCVG